MSQKSLVITGIPVGLHHRTVPTLTDTWTFELANSILAMVTLILKTLTVFVIISKLPGVGDQNSENLQR